MTKEYNKVFTIAGSDPSGGAGIQADIKTISALGCYAASAITSLTIQNTKGVSKSYTIDSVIVKEQIDAVMKDLKPDVLKIGMLCNKEIVEVVADSIRRYRPKWVVVDTVMISTSGRRLLSEEGCQTMIKELIPLGSIITPNIPEANVLGHSIEEICSLGCPNVLIKGGHQNGDILTDIFIENGKQEEIKNIKVETINTHGTGCTLSSAIAAYLAKGLEMRDSVFAAESYLQRAISSGADIKTGEGHGPVNFFFK